MNDKNELLGFERGFVSKDTVLWNSNACKGAAKGCETSGDDRNFKCTNHPAYQRASNHYWPNSRNDEECKVEKNPSNPAPKQAVLSPCRHAITAVVVTDNVLFSVIVLPNDGKFFHVKAGHLKFLDCAFAHPDG